MIVIIGLLPSGGYTIGLIVIVNRIFFECKKNFLLFLLLSHLTMDNLMASERNKTGNQGTWNILPAIAAWVIPGSWAYIYRRKKAWPYFDGCDFFLVVWWFIDWWNWDV